MLLAVLVDEPADRAADGVVHARDAAGADGDELLLGLSGAARQATPATPAARRGDDPDRITAISPLVGRLRAYHVRSSGPVARAASTARRAARRCASIVVGVDDEGRGEQHVVAAPPSIVPPIGIDHQPARHRLLLDAGVELEAGVERRLLPRSATSSMAWNRPRPRMSPTWWWLPKRSRRRRARCSPCGARCRGGRRGGSPAARRAPRRRRAGGRDRCGRAGTGPSPLRRPRTICARRARAPIGA